MKNVIAPLIVAIVMAVSVIVPQPAFGWYSETPSPQLGFPEDATPATIAKVLDFLRTDLTFVKGEASACSRKQ